MRITLRIASFLVGTGPVAAQMTYLSQARSATASAALTNPANVTISAPDFQPFDAAPTCSSTQSGCGSGYGEAEHHSMLAWNSTHFSGYAHGWGSGCTGMLSGGGSTSFQVTFRLTSTRPYVLSGIIDAASDYYGFHAITIELTGPAGLIAQRSIPLGSGQGNVDFTGASAIVGTLPPGQYTLAAWGQARANHGASSTANINLDFTIGEGCYANCDDSTTPPTLNIRDFECFLQRFVAGDMYTNCDGSSVGPTLTVQDFACFVNKFTAGCS